MSIRGPDFRALIVAFGLAACLGMACGESVAGALDLDTLRGMDYAHKTFMSLAPLAAGVGNIGSAIGSTAGKEEGGRALRTLTSATHDRLTEGADDGAFAISTAPLAGGGRGASFDVAITFTGSSGGPTEKQVAAVGSQPRTVCATDGDTRQIDPVVIDATRYVGVAPLAVLFDSTGTASTATARPFHELDYRWDFDDFGFHASPFPAGIGNWGQTVDGTGSSGSGANTSRKNDSGPIAAHVYEKPGTYRVRLTVRDVNGKSVTNNCIQIAVLDPEKVFAGKTACFSNDADFAGCPAGVPAAARFVTSNFVTAMANDSTYKRLLFHRGHTFDADSPVRMRAAGPGLVSAFGAGAAPRVRLTHNGDLFVAGGPAFSDWRLVDLDLDLNAAGNLARALKAGGKMTDVLLQRLRVRDGYHGYTFSDPGPDAPWDKIFIVDTTFENLMSNPTNGQGLYVSARRMAYLGNRINATRSHNSRFPHLDRAVLSHNYHSAPGPTTSNMKIHAPEFSTYPNSYTQKVVVSSNRFVSGSADWMIELQPQSNHNNEQLRDIIVEGNLFEAAAGFKANVISVSGKQITLRNNIVNLSASPNAAGFTVGRFGDCARTCEPLPENIDIFHNTFFTSHAGNNSTLKLITLRAEISAAFPVRVKNNLGYVPNQGARPPILVNDLATGTVKAGNSPGINLTKTNPRFAENFSLTAAYPIGGDATVPVMTDFFGAARPKPGVGTIGADQFP